MGSKTLSYKPMTCILHHSPVYLHLYKCTGILDVRDTAAVDQTGKYSGPPGDLKTDSKQKK